MIEQPRWSKWSGMAIAAGAIWLWQASNIGGLASLPIALLGGLLLASGVSQLFWPGELRITETGALAGLIGALVALPFAFGLGVWSFVILFASALAAAWGSGRMALQLEPRCEGVPVPNPTALLVSKVALDEAILGFEQFNPSGFALAATVERVVDEIDRLQAHFERKGLLEKPESYHATPPDLVRPEIRIERIGGHRIERLRFESGYDITPGEAGRERWLGYEPCREASAYVMRHEGTPRPWIICTNGYRMGHAGLDVRIFERFYSRVGLNVLIPVLPLHGPRRLGLQSGSGFLGIDVVDTLHAQAQSIWDMRRLLSWARGQGATAVGAFGLSLGGCATALFASVAEGLACAIPGIPLTDVIRILSRHASANQLRYAEYKGFDLERASRVLRVVSPLVLKPRVPLAARMIFGATADRLVPPDQVRDLWRHWDKPEIVWYNGAHVSFGSEREVWAGTYRTLRESGLRSAA